MEDPVLGAVVGALLTEVIGLVKKAWRCKENCMKLESTLNSVSPHVERMSSHGNEMCKKWLEELKSLLEEVKKIIKKYCTSEEGTWGTSTFAYLEKPRLSSLILDMDNQIKEKIHESNLVILHDAQSSHDAMLCARVESYVGFIPEVLPANIVRLRNDPFQKLKTLIMTKSDALDEPITIGLRGVGGIGKTLVAQMLYNDTDIGAKYGAESILWIHGGRDAKVSSVYGMMGKFLKDDTFECEYMGWNKEDQWMYLIKAFKKKEVFLILDDIWEQYSHGRSMIEWLDVAKGQGSVTVVTTRNATVLANAKAKQTIAVPLLSENEAWKLFCYNAFGINALPTGEIGKIARAICTKCSGLPLALKVMGGTMHGKGNPSEWEYALKYLKHPKRASRSVEKLFHHLKFSYNELDAEKKKCFLYFAAFPEDYQIPTKMLCSIWHAEQVFVSHDDDEILCFQEQGMMNLISLADQSLIDLSEDGETATMHDVLRDLAIRIIDEAKPSEWASECYFQPGKDLQRLPTLLKNKVKRVSLIGSTICNSQELLRLHDLQVLLLSGFHMKGNESESTIDICNKIFSSNSKLLYMDLSATILEELPKGIEELKSLTSLDLRKCSSLKVLPEGIKELKALTSLNLQGCSSLEELPEGIKELKALTSLDLQGCSSLEELPKGIKELKALTSLNLQGCSSLEELPEGIKELKALTSLNLQGCSSLEELPEGIKELKALTSLDLSSCSSLEELPEGIKELKVLTSLDLGVSCKPDGPGQAEDLWKTYIQCGEFEEFCSAHGIHGEDKIDMGRGRLTAALFPGAFRDHLAALMFASQASGAQDLTQDLPQYFKNASSFVLGDLPYAKNLQTGAFQFFDEARHGEPVNIDVIFRLGGLIAICQQFLPDAETNIEYCIVQHDLTGVYLCRRVERFAFNEDSVMEKAIGVLGLETTSDDILVENVRHDGSYYSGNLEDFSYKFVPNENGDVGQAVDNQCANRLFGHLKGAEFLAGKGNGLKCSPLLAIALAIAINRKNLALKWDMTSGHMDIKNSSLMEFENAKWQILYMDNINKLGFAVEWGMQQLVGSGASSSSPSQSKTSRSHCEENNSHDLQALASVFKSGVAQRRAVGVNLTLPGGVGIGGSLETFGSKGKDLTNATHGPILEHFDRSWGRFVETENLDPKHASVIECLYQGALSELPNNYLVVGDNVRRGHVSIYWADDEHGKYAWITDIILRDGKSTLFKGKGRCLKGLRMKVERDGSKFVTTDVSKSSDLMSRFKRHLRSLKLDIVGGNMKLVPLRSKSNDEWENLIGPHGIFSGNKYLWEATYMMAIISSRTKYSSGALLEMNVLEDELIGGIGSCTRDETDPLLVHKCENVVAWGRFSKAPASLCPNPIKWGGLIRDEDLC